MRVCRTPRLAHVLVASLAAAAVVVTACSREARHQVLVFLYDGVPPLDAATEVQVDIPDLADAPEDDQSKTVMRRGTKFYTHPLYWENRCESCHDAGGRLLQTVRHGLCQSCHFEKPEDKKKYYHGPVAVNDCLACHRLHRSRYEKILVTDPQTLCSYCHVQAELVQDRHHATMDTELCTKCHDPHGGDDRFFLLPGAREANPE